MRTSSNTGNSNPIRLVSIVLAVFVTLLASVPTRAAVPTVTHLFPAGGQRGTTVTVKVATKPFDPKPSIWCSDPELNAVFAEKADSITVEIPANAVPGLRWFRFYNDEGCSAARPFVVGMIPEVTETEPNNLIAAATTVDMPAVCVNGILHASGESDSFNVSLTAGQTLVATIDANRTLGSPMDAVLQLASPRGFVLAQNDDGHGVDPQLIFTAKDTGNYIVRTFAFPSTPNSTVGFSGAATYVYRLTISTGPYLAHVMPPVIGINAESAPTSTSRPVGWNLPADLEAAIQFEPTSAAVHSAFGELLANAIPVSSTSLPIVSEAIADKSNGGHAFTIPSTLCGTISSDGEVDRYQFDGKKGQKIRVQVEARSLFSFLDAVISVTGPDGKVLKEVDDSTRNVADGRLDVTLPADARYTVSIRDRFDHSGFRYFYAMHVRASVQDFSLSASGSPLTLTADKPIKLAVNLARDNFAADVTVSVTGLPEGVECKPVTSPGKGATAKKIELEFTSSRDQPWSGPVRIEGRGPESKPVHRAAAETIDLRRLDDFWLTVTPKK